MLWLIYFVLLSKLLFQMAIVYVLLCSISFPSIPTTIYSKPPPDKRKMSYMIHKFLSNSHISITASPRMRGPRTPHVSSPPHAARTDGLPPSDTGHPLPPELCKTHIIIPIFTKCIDSILLSCPETCGVILFKRSRQYHA